MNISQNELVKENERAHQYDDNCNVKTYWIGPFGLSWHGDIDERMDTDDFDTSFSNDIPTNMSTVENKSDEINEQRLYNEKIMHIYPKCDFDAFWQWPR